MDKADRKAALERELSFARSKGDDDTAKQIRASLAALEPKKKDDTPEPPARRSGEKVERAVVEPKAEKAVVDAPSK